MYYLLLICVILLILFNPLIHLLIKVLASAGLALIFLSTKLKPRNPGQSRIDNNEKSGYNALPFGCLAVDENFKITYFNSQAEALTSSINQNFIDLFAKSERQKIKDLLKSKTPYSTIEVNLAKVEKNSLLGVSYSAENKEYLIIMVDITKYKTLEINFIHSQKMQAVGQLAGAVAHDFNNLLTAIMGFCDLILLKNEQGNLESSEELSQIKQNVTRAADLVKQLLLFSRKQIMQPDILDLNLIVTDLFSLINKLIGENIKLNIEKLSDLPFIQADKSQIEQVIVNLAVNARDAMSSNGTLKVITRNIQVNSSHWEENYFTPIGEDPIPHGNYVMLEVTDTGSGINKETLNKVFEPFFSTKIEGTGLGLSTVYGIIKQTGGHIRIKTEEGAGASFYIFFNVASKVKETLDTSIQESEELESKSSVEHGEPKRGKILVVEDENPVRIFSAHALVSRGYEVLQADCADAALNIVELEGGNIEMIITDVMMPGMTGPKMVEKIHKEYPSIKIIFISGYAEDALNKESRGPNFHFLAKPFTLKQLAAKVQEVIVN